MDPISLAAAALAALTPYLLHLGGVAVDEGAKSAGKSVLEWVKGKLTSASGKEALQDLEKAPREPINQQALQIALAKMLKDDKAAAAELAKLLPGGLSFGDQTANVFGSDNKVGLNQGSGSVTIS